MFEKIKNKKTTKVLADVRTLEIIASGIIALIVTWSSVNVVETNYGLLKQISKLQQENDVAKLENTNLMLKNEYLNTSEYLELSARRHFNKALPGETLVIVPRSVALSYTIELPNATSANETKSATSKESGSVLERNFNAWLDFLFHRGSQQISAD